jgi:hypothetical protein
MRVSEGLEESSRSVGFQICGKVSVGKVCEGKLPTEGKHVRTVCILGDCVRTETRPERAALELVGSLKASVTVSCKRC